jgi:hypothetical protein
LLVGREGLGVVDAAVMMDLRPGSVVREDPAGADPAAVPLQAALDALADPVPACSRRPSTAQTEAD